MLSFESSIESDLKTQSSSGSWVERVLLTPPNIGGWTFSGFILVKNTLRALRRPLVHLLWGKIIKKKIVRFCCCCFFLVFVFDFLDFLDFFSFFSVASSVSSSSKTLLGHWKCWRRLPWHFFGQFRKIKKKLSHFFLSFFRFFKKK